jgi:hypothetical protein
MSNTPSSPGSQLSTNLNPNQPLTNPTISKYNFMAWGTQILAYLKSQGSYGFVDESSLPPPQTITNTSIEPRPPATVVNPEFLTWSQQDQMILNILVSTLSKPYVVHALGCATTFDLWSTLMSMFASQAKSRVLHIHF